MVYEKVFYESGWGENREKMVKSWNENLVKSGQFGTPIIFFLLSQYSHMQAGP